MFMNNSTQIKLLCCYNIKMQLLFSWIRVFRATEILRV